MTKPQVSYELVMYDELPPAAARGGGAGKSILNSQLEQIKGGDPSDPKERGNNEWVEIDGHKVSQWKRPVRIGLYVKSTAATAAKNVLQQRFGRTAAVLGWTFATRNVPLLEETGGVMTDDTPKHRGLWATYNPDKIVDGALQAHELKEEQRKAALKAKREAEVEDEEAELEDEEYEDEDEYEDEAES